MYTNKGGNGQVSKAIKEHFDMVNYMECRGLSFTKKGREMYCNQFRGLCVNPATQTFYNHKIGKGGSIIDLVMMLDDVSVGDALSSLRKEMGGCTPTLYTQKYEKFKELDIPKVFTLPKSHQGKYSRLFAYLTKTRFIQSKVVADMVGRKMLYEDGKFHNCVFVGYDYDKEAKYSSIRSTGEKKIAYDITESKKEIGWFVNNNKPTLFVCESPIDAMSIMSLLSLGGKNHLDYSYLAQGGATPIKTLIYHIQKNTNISKIYLAYDNDEAGINAVERAKEELSSIGFGGKVITKLPINNDFNDDLKAHTIQSKGIVQTVSKAKVTEENLCITR